MKRTLRHSIPIFLCFIGAISASSASETAAVSNRSPEAGEVAYFPEDGAVVKVNPPGFVWLPEKEAVSYILQCSSRNDFSIVEYDKTSLLLNVHCPAAALDPGRWYWRYAYVAEDGTIAGWSLVRSFTLAEDAVELPQPALTTLLRRLPKQHPKLFLRPEEAKPFRENIASQKPQLWNDFIQQADRMLETPITVDEPAPYPEGRRFSDSKEDIDLWRKNTGITVRAVEHAANLAFAYLLSGEEKYGVRAREWMLAVCSWPPNGTTSYRYNDECGMPILSRIPRAFTWAYNALTPQDREKIVQCMKIRGEEVYHYLRDSRHQTVRPYESHANRAWHFMGETAIAFIDDIPEAQEWLQYAMDIFFNVYPVWNDDDGGWHEGTAYWGSYINRITWWMDILRAGFGIDGFKKPYFSHAGDFPLYVNPPGSSFGGFSDGSDMHFPASDARLMNALARQTGNPYWMWYAEQAGDRSSGDKPDYQVLLRANLPNVTAKAPDDLPSSKIFHGVGVASLHSNLAQSASDVHFLFKSSPFGRQSHGFNAQNSFVLSVFGKPVLLWSGHRDWHGSPHHTQWMWETKSDNSITVDDVGQIKHNSRARGKIFQERLGEDVDYLAGDATESYGGRLNKFVRRVFFVKPDAIVMVDELEAPEPATFQFYLHAKEEFLIKNPKEIVANNGESSVLIAFATPSDLKITQTSEFDPPPIGMDLKQWHLKAETTEKQKEMTFITYMKAYPAGKEKNMLLDAMQRGNQHLYGFSDIDFRLGLVLNPGGEKYTMSKIENDAKILLIIEKKGEARESSALAVEAKYYRAFEKTLLDKYDREILFVSSSDLKEEKKE
ncbi:MAG: DUF4962 domain-containing protein [Candidatus Omnitrophota bacterium]